MFTELLESLWSSLCHFWLGFYSLIHCLPFLKSIVLLNINASWKNGEVAPSWSWGNIGCLRSMREQCTRQIHRNSIGVTEASVKHLTKKKKQNKTVMDLFYLYQILSNERLVGIVHPILPHQKRNCRFWPVAFLRCCAWQWSMGENAILGKEN